MVQKAGSVTSSFSFLIPLVVHSLFEGMIVGAAKTSVSVWISTAAIAGHKWVECFAVASKFLHARVSAALTVFALVLIVVASPVGCGIVMGVRVAIGPGATGTISAMSLGMVFSAGCELLYDDSLLLPTVRQRLLLFCAVILGAGIIFSLMLLDMAG
eukprot:GHVU01122372.1.p3 GENE.GHVU01122372.1~~GHVU01122372.1.p3  ORF type:complete len:157 (-),score=30.95 GHVU01122372.1:1058-1528(-)